jgi:hypothetical protein
MSKPDALLPCKRCKSDKADTEHLGGVWYVECLHCEAQGPLRWNEAQAIAAWNRRAGQAYTDGLVAALEAELSEQARVNGMGGEREAGYLARIAGLEAEVARLREALLEGAKAVVAQAARLPVYFPEQTHSPLPSVAIIMQGHFNGIAAGMTAALNGGNHE